MAEFAKSARVFLGGIARRLWSLIPGVLLGVVSIYDALIKPYLPSDWQKVSLAAPFPLVLGLLLLGLGWAALLTFHELRMQSEDLKRRRSLAAPLVGTVESGATVVINNYTGNPGFSVSSNADTASGTATAFGAAMASIANPQPTLWDDQSPSSDAISSQDQT